MHNLKNKICKLYNIDYFVFINSMLYLFIFFYKLFIDKSIIIDSHQFLLPLILTSILATMMLLTKDTFKEIIFYSFMFSLVSIPSIIIIDNFIHIHFDQTNKKIFFAFFNFVRAIFYYYIIKSIFCFFNVKNEFSKIVTYFYFIFMILNMGIYYIGVFEKNENGYFFNFLFKLNHYTCYIFKTSPFVIAITLAIISTFRKISINGIILMLSSIANCICIVYQIYYIEKKSMITLMPYMMMIQLLMFTAPIYALTLSAITKKLQSIDDNNKYLLFLVSSELHNIKNSFILNNQESFNEKILKSIKSMERISDLQSKSINIKNFVENIVDEFTYSDICEQKNISINFVNLLPNMEIEINVRKLKLLVSNLINNAIQYNSNKKNPIITIEASIHNISYFKKIILNQKLIFKVKNEGNIPKDIYNKIYEKGFSTKNNSHNSGNGLYECKEIVNYFKGEIYHSSTNNEVEFCFIIGLTRPIQTF